MIDLSIICVTYRSEDKIKRLLDSIDRHKDHLKIEIIIVNNYPDKTPSIAKHHKTKPKLIENDQNIGYAKATNIGIRNSSGKFILLLNPDTQIIGNALTKLIEYSRDNKIGAVAPELINEDGSVQASVFKFPTITNAFKAYFLDQRESFGKYFPGKKITNVDVAVMAALLIPRSVIDKVGFLDERFFLYYEDIEYCRRLKKHNLPVVYYHLAKIKHTHGASGSFTCHLDSPLARSAQIYHGKTYSYLLNLTLWLGQKWQKLTSINRQSFQILPKLLRK